MRYNNNGINVIIPDDEIEKSIKKLDLSKEEAIQLWLEDNDYFINEEQIELNNKAIKSNVSYDVRDNVRENKPTRKIKVSDTKKSIFETILTNLDRNEFVNKENITILKENKLIQIKIGDDIFKIDLIQQRKPK